MTRTIFHTNEIADTTEAYERKCLICGTLTRYAHMEIDACRACSVFYRRLIKRGKPISCRTGLGKCDLTIRGNFSCKKCRYDRFIEVLSDSETPRNDSELSSVEENSPSTSSPEFIQPAPAKPDKGAASEYSVIANVRRGRVVMNAIRRASELGVRTSLPDKKGIVADGMTLIPANSTMCNQHTSILISSMIEFASTSFEEFTTLDDEDKWLLIRNFYPFIAVLDTEYRMTKFAPEQKSMIFISYGTYLDHDTVDQFFADAPSEKHHEDERKKFLLGHLKEAVPLRAGMKRWNPSEDEFSAIIGICFWSLDKGNVSEHLLEMAVKYRRLLFLELESLYRDQMHLDDYASRMGQGMLFVSTVQGYIHELSSKLEVLKLLDVVWEDMPMTHLLL